MNISWTDNSWKDYLYWQNKDKKLLKKINSLTKDIKREPYNGIRQPEPLKYELSKCYSRRITNEHKLVYEVHKSYVIIIGCRYHY